MYSIFICVQYKLDPDLTGGMDRYCWALDDALKEHGYEPKWFFPISYGEKYLEKGLDLVFIDHKDFLQGVYQYLVTNELKPDIMLTHFTRYFTKEMGWYKKYGIKKIISFEHLYRDLNSRSLINELKVWIKGILYYKYCTQIAYVSHYVYDQALREYWPIKRIIRKKLLVVYNGVDTDAYSPSTLEKENETLRLVCACRIVKAKGLHIMIEAVEVLEKAGYVNKFQIDVYGEGYDKEEFVKTLSTREIKSIRFLSNTNNLNELLCGYDVAVFPTFGEAHPFFVLESFASGLPIIATRVGGIPEMVSSERGFLVAAGSTEELKNAILLCIENKKQLPEMGKKCREFVLSDFTLNHMIDRHLELLGNKDSLVKPLTKA